MQFSDKMSESENDKKILTQSEGNPQNSTIPDDSEKPSTTPGFLCLSLRDISDAEACKCESKESCLNIQCMIEYHMKDRPYMRRTYRDQGGMIIVPIEKFGNNSIDAMETNNVVAESMKLISNAMETDDKESGAMAPDTIKSETHALCKDIDSMIQTKLKQMTNLEEPSTKEELALLLQATRSDEFRQMLADKYDEIAASENGEEKVKIIEEHYKNRNTEIYYKN